MSDLWEAGLGGAERLLGARYLFSILLPVLLTALASGLVALSAAGHTPGDALRTWQDCDANGHLVATTLGSDGT